MCAYNPHNSGMYSVDLSARQYFTALGVDHELCVSQNRTRVGVLRYRLVRSADELRHIDTLARSARISAMSALGSTSSITDGTRR
jgi:hypothetical protein